jgi:hypothetical protein
MVSSELASNSTNKTIRCRLFVKALLAVFKSKHVSEKGTVETLEIRINEEEARVIFRLYHQYSKQTNEIDCVCIYETE